MVKTKLVKAAGRFGARYGQRVKRKIANIESKQRQKQKCPFCGKTVKRLSKGIWKCKRCQKKFAAHAYYIEEGSVVVKTKKPLQEKVKEKKESKTLKEEKPTPKKETKKKTTKKPTKKSK